MNNQNEELVKLQELEKQIVKLDKRLRELPLQLKALDDRIFERGHSVEQAQQSISENQQRRLAQEKKVESVKAEIQNKKRELNSIKTNKEYTAKLAEIEIQEKRKEEAEEGVIQLLLDADKMQETIGEVKERSRLDVEALQKEKDLFLQEKGEKEGQLKELNQRKKELRTLIDPENLRIYESLSKKTGGVPLSVVTRDFCAECFVKIRPQVMMDLRKGDKVIYCENCHRVLILEPVKVQE